MRRLAVAAAVVVSWCVPASSFGASDRALLTGDSMMENIGAPLSAVLRDEGVDVVLEPIAGTGLTIPIVDWLQYARRQMSVVPKPTFVVMFNGAGDSQALPVGGRMVVCCRASWRAAYAERVASMMRTYGRVYWLTLPMPENRGYASVLAAVNRSVRDGARRVGRPASVVDLVPALTPGRRFRRVLRGEVVRDRDGIHLTAAGARIAVGEVRRAMRRDGLLD